MTSFKLEVIDKIAALMTAAFGLIAALAWNAAISKLMEDWLGTGGDQTIGLLIYAIIITIIAVIAIIMIARTYNRLKSKEDAKALALADAKADARAKE
ncbi:MAG TPA: DUF5654 family protein [Methanomassiliicoccales archaeon]|nr:DUF5654 family protein [Methanomassiliicoccales archaeon]